MAESVIPQGSFYVEEGILPVYQFWMETAKDAKLNSLNFKLLAWNNLTDESFELDNFPIDISDSIISEGIQELDVDTTRGYKLSTNDQFNFVKIIKGLLVGTKQYYEIQVALKLTWQDWIKVLDADTIFYDNTKPQNNLNKLSANYSELNNYSIRLALCANVYGTNDLGVSGDTDYTRYLPAMKVYNYDESENFSLANIETFNYDTGFDLDGQIRNDGYTILKCTFTHIDGAVVDISDYYGITRIQKTADLGANIYELSSIRPYPNNNLLIPIDGGYTTLYITLEGGLVVTYCMIDYTKLEEGVGYNLSGYINDGVGVVTVGKITEAGDDKITEDDDEKNIRLMADIKEITYVNEDSSSGIVTRLLGASLPKLDTIPVNDICYCDYACEYTEKVFASISNDWWKNDKNEFLFQKLVSSDTISIQICKEGVIVATIGDSTYGDFYDFGYFNDAPLYCGFVIDWQKVMNTFGYGFYKIKAQQTIIGTTSEFESRRFRLLPYSDILANNTVRIETYQTGNILNSSFDFSKMLEELPNGWYSSYRIPAFFGNKTPKIEVNNYLSSSYKVLQNTSKNIDEYSLETEFLPAVIANRISDTDIHSNKTLLTDYSILNTEIFRRIELTPTGDIETTHFTGNRNTIYTIKFNKSEQNNIKTNF